jgi:hypothetical protein
MKATVKPVVNSDGEWLRFEELIEAELEMVLGTPPRLSSEEKALM